MYLTQYDPFINLTSKLWDPLFRPGSEQRLIPAADIVERNNGWLFRVDMPGIEKDDIDIQVDGDHLVVSGKRHEHKEETKDGYVHIERTDGFFERRFVLPETVHRDKISAKTKNGVLEVHVEKKAEVKPRRIRIDQT